MPVRATYLHDQPPAFGQGLRLAIFQGEGPAATRDAIGQNLETLSGVAALAQNYGAQLSGRSRRPNRTELLSSSQRQKAVAWHRQPTSLSPNMTSLSPLIYEQSQTGKGF